MLQCFFTVMMAWTLMPVYIFHAVNSISSPHDKVLLSSASKQCWFSNTQRTPTHIQLASHGICWNTATTGKQAVARLFRQLFGHMATLGCPGRWNGKCNFKIFPVFSFYKRTVQMSLLYLRNKLFYVFFITSLKGENQKPTLSLFLKFRACSILVDATMHLAKDPT